MRGTVLRPEVFEDKSEFSPILRAWLNKWKKDTALAVDELYLFYRQDTHEDEWLVFLFKNEGHIVPADELDAAMLAWLDAHWVGFTDLGCFDLGTFLTIFWGGVFTGMRERRLFRKSWKWFVDHRNELENLSMPSECWQQGLQEIASRIRENESLR